MRERASERESERESTFFFFFFPTTRNSLTLAQVRGPLRDHTPIEVQRVLSADVILHCFGGDDDLEVTKTLIFIDDYIIKKAQMNNLGILNTLIYRYDLVFCTLY